MYTLRRTEDVDQVRELHDQVFGSSYWPGDDQEYWLAFDGHGALAGFCSAKYSREHNTVSLTRAAVVRGARCAGLQRRMIRVRLAWARRIGAVRVVTYCSVKNYPSMTNLLRCGFRFRYAPRAWKGFHWMYSNLRPRMRVPSVKLMLNSM